MELFCANNFFAVLFLTFLNHNVSTGQTTEGPKKIVCPLICNCDKFRELLRASCVERNLLSIEANVPKEVEMLDLSYNVVSKLPSNIFLELELTSIRWLNLSHNSIREINLRAFRGLALMEVLDLSFNHLQYLVTDWFWENTNLKELRLHHNSFGTFGPGPLLDSESLKVLDLSYSAILFLPRESFSKLNNLSTLDIRGNYLSEISENVLAPLEMLNRLLLKNNSIKCNTARYDIIRDYCIQNDIKLDQKCMSKQGKDKEEKFQKMVVPEDLPPIVEEETFWLIEDLTVKTFNNCTCHVNATLKGETNTTQDINNLLSKVFHLSPPLLLGFMVCVGFLVGLILGCTIQLRPAPSAEDTSTVSSRRRRRSIIRPIHYQQKWDDIEILLHRSNSHDPSSTTPVMSTRRPRIASSYY